MFSNILSTAIYPYTWKLANVTPIFNKGDEQTALLLKISRVFDPVIRLQTN